jgi:hypothetical protein
MFREVVVVGDQDYSKIGDSLTVIKNLVDAYRKRRLTHVELLGVEVSLDPAMEPGKFKIVFGAAKSDIAEQAARISAMTPCPDCNYKGAHMINCRSNPRNKRAGDSLCVPGHPQYEPP